MVVMVERDAAAAANDYLCGVEGSPEAPVHALRQPNLHVFQTSEVCHYPSWELTQERKLSPALNPTQSSGNMSL